MNQKQGSCAQERTEPWLLLEKVKKSMIGLNSQPRRKEALGEDINYESSLRELYIERGFPKSLS